MDGCCVCTESSSDDDAENAQISESDYQGGVLTYKPPRAKTNRSPAFCDN